MSGRVSMPPQSLQETIAKAQRAIEKHALFQLDITLGDDGRQEIVDAVRYAIREKQTAVGLGGDFADCITPDVIGRRSI